MCFKHTNHNEPGKRKKCYLLFWCWDVEASSVLMSHNFSKTPPRLSQVAKEEVESKEWCVHRVERLWLDTKPRAPSAAAWSAHSFPRFSAWPYTCCMVNRSLCWTFSNDCGQVSASCTCVRARIVPKQTPAACLESQNTRVRITSNWAMGSKKGQGLNHGRHFSGAVGVSSGTCQCQTSFCRDDWAKHDIYPSMAGSCDSTPSS